ncbi:WASH complex subunit 3 [Topomyia yanbarensis]|uniref:WASH complex subunit 3 n=1 Tax=Topomyia yanbarensis TaxID=2498891 RepID=UPI00273CADF3|nr:WASH complex subunit 3 [Topomyia yanbarensis]
MESVGLEKRELPPTNQKRMVAFINHFVLSTVGFLNNFASDCENKFIEYERKIQSLEASILIVEAKIASINALKSSTNVTECDQPESNARDADADNMLVETTIETPSEIVSERDARYDKYFKMIQFGVPAMAVKNKISSDGLDPDYIDRI